MTYQAWMEDESTLRVSRTAGSGEPSQFVMVASMNLRVGDWAVYMGQGDPVEVGRHGDKIGVEQATAAFPQFAKAFRYRA